MKKIEEVIEDVRYGHSLTIMKNNLLVKKNYSACFVEYDGRIIKDVKEVELGNFLEQIPNIKSKINGIYYYQLKYDYEKHVYQSAIMHEVRQGGYKESFTYEVLNDLVTENSSLVDGMIDLDTKIANTTKMESKKNLKKELVS